MQLRLILALGLVAAPACNGDDDPPGAGTGGPDTASMTMTLTTMTTSPVDGTTDETASGTTAGTADGDTLDADSDSTGEPLPVCDGRCVELAPEGWSGPVVTADTDPLGESPTCSRKQPTPAVEAFDDFEFEPAICDCDCGEAEGIVCDPIGSLLNYGDAEDCDGPLVDTTNLTSGVCTGESVAANAYFRLSPVGILGLGSCEPIAATELPSPSFGTRVTACDQEVAAGTSCDAMPSMGCLAEDAEAPFSERLCIWQEGEHACPEDSAYIDDRVLYTEFVDDRSCTECTCDEPFGVCDNSNLLLYSSNACAVGLTGLASGEGFCAQNTGASITARYLAGAPSAFCPAMPVEPTGEASPAQPITLCCTA